MLISLALSFFLQSPAQTYDHVFLISVDGLRSDALLVSQAQSFTNLQRLMTGAFTTNARTDCDVTSTLPNHVGMLCGRAVNGAQGHHYTGNVMPAPNVVLKTIDNQIIESIFNRTAAAQIHSSLIASKAKFVLFKQSYEQLIDDFFISPDPGEQMQHLLNDLKAHQQQRSLNFIHFLQPDVAGHYFGWNLTPDSKYMQSVAAVDNVLGQLFSYLDANPEYAKRSAIVLTADHGGGAPHKNHHGIGHLWVNYVIPFIVWTGDGQAQGDLFELNLDTFADPGIADPQPGTSTLAAIRNSDSGNLCLDLLGIPAISNSTRNVQQNLKITK
ncbi:MAG: alkaline phosphatase family protein [Planctomycetes bacterium]|nr:alkaline phosphatase family protein [Planctomycetota bacterium]